MKAISIKQPWASLIVEGIKDVENRNWFTYFRGPLYIHTGRRFDMQGAKLVSELYPEYKSIVEKSEDIRGGIIGHVQMVNCVTKYNSRWFHGKYGFIFQSPQKIDFHPLKGTLSIFDFEFDELGSKARKEKQLDLFI